MRHMSRGIGRCYMHKEGVLKHHLDNLDMAYVQTEAGVKIGLPRYYKDRYLTPEQKEEIFTTNFRNSLERITEEIEDKGIVRYRKDTENSREARKIRYKRKNQEEREPKY